MKCLHYLLLCMLLRTTSPAAEIPAEQTLRWPETAKLERVETAGQEWRDAWRIPAGETRYDLGPLPPGAALRMGLLCSAEEGAESKARVFVGEKLITSLACADPEEWADHRIDLSSYPSGREHCYLVFDNTHPCLVGPCKLFSPDNSAPLVIVFLIDTLRLDHMSCYGYRRPTTPHIDKLAADGLLFTQLCPAASWTRASVASLFTSTYPCVHGAEDRPDIMRPGLPSLAQSLRDAGFEASAFVFNANCHPRWGFGNDFDRYYTVYSSDEEVLDLTVEALALSAGLPRYFYVHTLAPHGPYTPPNPEECYRFFSPVMHEMVSDAMANKNLDKYTQKQRRFLRHEHDKAMYDGEIIYVDEQFARMIAQLKELGLYERALIILVSDHGEEFWEHKGSGHGYTLYEEVLRVPLIVKMPGGAHAGEQRDALVEMVDIAPTVLDILNLPAEPRFMGKSFRQTISQGGAHRSQAYASLRLNSRSARAAKTTQTKYIENIADSEELWFDLHEDPEERNPLPETPADGPALKAHVKAVQSRGAQGLHLLITAKSGETRTIAGSITGAQFTSSDLRYPGRKSEIQTRKDNISFRLEMKHLTEEDVMSSRDLLELAVDHAEIHVPLAADLNAHIAITLTAEGEPFPIEDVFVGHTRQHVPLDGSPIPLNALVAEPRDFDPITLPRRSAVYLWFVPEAQSISDENLSPEVVEELRAMGYIE